MTDESEGEKKKRSIHDTGGGITTHYTMAEIEKAFHPRAKELVQAELEDLVSGFADKHRDAKTGSIKNPEKAADEFMLMVAKYHFGDAFETLKSDKRQIAKILQDTYGITRENLRTAFEKKGAYVNRRSIFEKHVDPYVDTVVKQKQETAQQSLNTYLTDGETRPQVQEHLEKRTGRKLRKGKYLTLQDAVNIIGSYMAIPGSEKVIGHPEEGMHLPDEVAGRPEIHHIFEGGDEAHKAYRKVPEKVDSEHRFKYKKLV